MMVFIHNDWQDVLQKEFDSPNYQKLHQFLKNEYATQTIYPEKHHIYEAFENTPFAQVKVVILGQDPYHGPNQAHGLSFSVLPGQKIPPSLVNIYQELQSDLGYKPVSHGYLKKWTQEGVLMLNTVLTVRKGEAYSHHHQGWEELTDLAIQALSAKKEMVVFILWGKPAQAKAHLIDEMKNVILKAPHPSPLAAYRGFFGSKPFSKTNAVLIKNGLKPIDWQLPEKAEL